MMAAALAVLAKWQDVTSNLPDAVPEALHQCSTGCDPDAENT